MDLLSDQIVSLLVTTFALIIAGAVYADMYMNGIAAAGPRDAIALLVFTVGRLFIGRNTRTTRTTQTQGSGDGDGS
jgi:hypothetical protein